MINYYYRETLLCFQTIHVSVSSKPSSICTLISKLGCLMDTSDVNVILDISECLVETRLKYQDRVQASASSKDKDKLR